jgi:hypothetical protein
MSKRQREEETEYIRSERARKCESEEWHFEIRATPKKECTGRVVEVRKGSKVWYWSPTAAYDWFDKGPSEGYRTTILTPPNGERREAVRGSEKWVIQTPLGSMLLPMYMNNGEVQMREVEMHGLSSIARYWTPEWLLIRRDADRVTVPILEKVPNHHIVYLDTTALVRSGKIATPSDYCEEVEKRMWENLEEYEASSLPTEVLYPEEEEEETEEKELVDPRAVGKGIHNAKSLAKSFEKQVESLSELFSPLEGPVLDAKIVASLGPNKMRTGVVCHIATAYHWQTGLVFSVVVPYGKNEEESDSSESSESSESEY